MTSGIWWIALFAKGKTDDSCPDWKIPIGLIANCTHKYVKDPEDDSVKKGLLQIEMKCTLDVHYTVEPMWIEIFICTIAVPPIIAFCTNIEREGKQENLVMYKKPAKK